QQSDACGDSQAPRPAEHAKEAAEGRTEASPGGPRDVPHGSAQAGQRALGAADRPHHRAERGSDPRHHARSGLHAGDELLSGHRALLESSPQDPHALASGGHLPASCRSGRTCAHDALSKTDRGLGSRGNSRTDQAEAVDGSSDSTRDAANARTQGDEGRAEDARHRNDLVQDHCGGGHPRLCLRHPGYGHWPRMPATAMILNKVGWAWAKLAISSATASTSLRTSRPTGASTCVMSQTALANLPMMVISSMSRSPISSNQRSISPDERFWAAQFRKASVIFSVNFPSLTTSGPATTMMCRKASARFSPACPKCSNALTLLSEMVRRSLRHGPEVIISAPLMARSPMALPMSTRPSLRIGVNLSICRQDNNTSELQSRENLV